MWIITGMCGLDEYQLIDFIEKMFALHVTFTFHHMTGNLASTWRISTPPPSPPNQQAFMVGPPSSLRRAASLDISSTLNTPWDAPRPSVRVLGDNAVQVTSLNPSTGHGNIGLADAAGMLSPGQSAVYLEAIPLPESTFFKWSCGHFSRPLLEPVHDDEEEISARRERRDREAQDGITKCQHSSKWLLGNY